MLLQRKLKEGKSYEQAYKEVGEFVNQCNETHKEAEKSMEKEKPSPNDQLKALCKRKT